jgi:hypothetical protein
MHSVVIRSSGFKFTLTLRSAIAPGNLAEFPPSMEVNADIA